MALYNESGVMWQIVSAMTTNITGSDSLTFISILLLFLGIMSLAKIPFPLQCVFITPFVLVMMTISSTFMLIGGIVLFCLAAILAKVFFF